MLYTKKELENWFDKMINTFKNSPMGDHLIMVKLLMLDDERFGI